MPVRVGSSEGLGRITPIYALEHYLHCATSFRLKSIVGEPEISASDLPEL